jgi:hypothetical protein
MTIELPSRSVREYLAQFGVAAIFVTRSCVGRDLARVGPVAAAWWARDRATADQILMALGEQHPATIEGAIREILAAAARLDITLSNHATVLARAKAAVAELDAKLLAANSTGVLTFFNTEYRRRRIAAHAAGKRFMAYGEAHRRLRQALAAAAADWMV